MGARIDIFLFYCVNVLYKATLYNINLTLSKKITKMRKITIIAFFVICITAMGWGGYWLLNAVVAKKEMGRIIDTMRTKGWDVNYDQLQLRGFPNRVDMRFVNINITAPHQQWHWQAETLDILRLVYQFDHFIIILPFVQQIEWKNQIYHVHSKAWRASVEIDPQQFSVLKRLVVDIQHGRVEHANTTRGWEFQNMLWVLGTNDGMNTSVYRTALQAQQVKSIMQGHSDPANVGVDVDFDGKVVFNNAVDLWSLLDHLPQLKRIDIQKAGLEWSDTQISSKTALVVDDMGFLDGTLQIQVSGWHFVPRHLAALYILPTKAVNAIEQALQKLDSMIRLPDPFTLPIVVRKGRLFYNGVIAVPLFLTLPNLHADDF